MANETTKKIDYGQHATDGDHPSDRKWVDAAGDCVSVGPVNLLNPDAHVAIWTAVGKPVHLKKKQVRGLIAKLQELLDQ